MRVNDVGPLRCDNSPNAHNAKRVDVTPSIKCKDPHTALGQSVIDCLSAWHCQDKRTRLVSALIKCVLEQKEMLFSATYTRRAVDMHDAHLVPNSGRARF